MYFCFQIADARRSMKHAEVVIARQAVEEGRGLVVIVNKMDLLRGKKSSTLYERVMQAVPEEIQTVIPEVWHSFLVLRPLLVTVVSQNRKEFYDGAFLFFSSQSFFYSAIFWFGFYYYPKTRKGKVIPLLSNLHVPMMLIMLGSL